jgi:hypothetical protein
MTQMTIAFIKLNSYENRVIQFWKDNVNAASVAHLDVLIDSYNEHAVEAGPNGQFCEYTREMLAPLKAEIDDRLETILERYADWASD